MKVLWLCSWYPNSKDPFDGDFIERHARSLATQQELDVIHVVQNLNILKAEGYRSEERFEHNIRAKVYFIPVMPFLGKKINSVIFNYRYFKTIHKILKEYVAKNGLPDIVHVHVPVKLGVGAIWLKRKFNIPFVVTEHSTGYFQNSHDNYFDNGFQFKYVTKKSFAEATAVASVSDHLMRVLNNLFPIKRTYLIRNSVNTDFFYPLDTDNSIKRFLHVSMMVPFKNIEGILNGLAILNVTNDAWHMVFVGPASSHQIELAVSLGIDQKITWKGVLPYVEVAKEMQQADALIHFSKYENLPCVIGEALCCGIPVISSDVGGIAELVNINNGILVQEGNIEELVTAMSNFLNKKLQYNKRSISLGASALLNYETIGRQILKMYDDVVRPD
ncbi:MAG: glycosyltransferase [Lacibacter sp.]|nr:glycosyltransferase [Lacibacter sp.]